jgi:hypothetical protein
MKDGGDRRMDRMAGIGRVAIVLRYASIALCLLVLWVQSSLGRSQNALVICMVSVAAFMIMVNRLTNREDRGPAGLIIALAAFTVCFSLLFFNEIRGFLPAGPVQSTLTLLAAGSGIGGAYFAQKRTSAT